MTIDDKLSFQEFSPNNLKQMFVPDNSRRSSSFGSFKIIEFKWGIEKTEPLSGLRNRCRRHQYVVQSIYWVFQEQEA